MHTYTNVYMVFAQIQTEKAASPIGSASSNVNNKKSNASGVTQEMLDAADRRVNQSILAQVCMCVCVCMFMSVYVCGITQEMLDAADRRVNQSNSHRCVCACVCVYVYVCICVWSHTGNVGCSR